MNPKPVKVVVVSSFNKNKRSYYPAKDTDAFYVASWGALFARRLRAIHPDFDIEVWRPEAGFTETSHRVAFDVPCTIFPYQYPVISDIITLEMLRLLFRYQKKHTLVIHLHSIYNYKFNILTAFFLKKTRIILSHHGGKIPEDKSLKSYLKRKVYLFSYKKTDTLTYLRKNIKDAVEKMRNPPRLEFLPVGANFDAFQPLDRTECRKKLGLKPDKIYAVYVGRFYRLKGVDHILSAFEQLRNKNFEILFIGGLPTDDLFDQVVNSGNRYWGYIPQTDLAEIYSAADFYIHPVFDPLFGGIDITWMEALACGIPVVSSMFNELTFDYSDFGMSIQNESEILEKVSLMIEKHATYKLCREAAQKHLDGNSTILDKLYKIYTGIPAGTHD